MSFNTSLLASLFWALLAAGCGSPPGGDSASGGADSTSGGAAFAAPGADFTRSGTAFAPGGADSTPDRVVDDGGRALQPTAPPRRVLSLVPSLTEVVLFLGEGHRLVGRTRYDRDPRVRGLPSVGQPVTPSVEAVARLRPDLVLAWADEGDPRILDRLEDQGLPVYRAEIRSLSDLRRHTRNLGRLLGVEATAGRRIAWMDRGLAEVRARVDGRPRPSVFYVIWPDPPTTTGPGTYLDSLIALAGGRNLFSDARGAWPRVSLEEVVRRDPDVVVLAGRGGNAPSERSWIRARTGWRSLTAVREGRILAVDADLFERPGPRVVEAARTLARFLHPPSVERGPGEETPGAGRSPEVRRPDRGQSPEARTPGTGQDPEARTVSAGQRGGGGG